MKQAPLLLLFLGVRLRQGMQTAFKVDYAPTSASVTSFQQSVTAVSGTVP